MAEVEQFIASVQFGDSTGRFASAAVRVGATDARAYIAAANAGARIVTKVGLLLDAMANVSAATGGTHWKKYSIESNFINDAYVQQPTGDMIYNSNRWKVTGTCLNNGIPVFDSFYIPQRLDTITMESNGVNALLADGSFVADLVAQVVDTALSKYGTPFIAVTELVANDI